MEQGGTVELELPDGKIALTVQDLNVNRAEKEGVTVATEHGITLALDTALTHELVLEGLAREFVSKVQNMRKEANLEVSDRILLHEISDPEVEEALNTFRSYVCSETLAETVENGGIEGALLVSDCDLNGHACRIFLKKA